MKKAEFIEWAKSIMYASVPEGTRIVGRETETYRTEIRQRVAERFGADPLEVLKAA